MIRPSHPASQFVRSIKTTSARAVSAQVMKLWIGLLPMTIESVTSSRHQHNVARTLVFQFSKRLVIVMKRYGHGR